jgi:hypothetical protein
MTQSNESVKRPRGRMVAAIVLAAVLLAGSVTGLLLDLANRRDKAGEMSRVVLTCGDYKMTNTELAYYYWSEYFYFTKVYSGYLKGMFDASKPLSEQMYDKNTTWQDYLLKQALVTVKDTLSMSFRAKEKGYKMPSDYEKSYETVLSNFSDYAKKLSFTKEDGSADVDAYLQDSYGEGATLETFKTYLYDSYLASAYADSLYNAVEPSAEEVETYFDAHAGDYEDVSKTDKPLPDVLLLEFSTYDDNKSTAATVYATWKDKKGDADALSALSKTYCGGDGKLEAVYPGQLADAVNDWLFDSARQAGDSAVLDGTDGKAYIILLTQYTDQYRWRQLAEKDLRTETYNNEYLAIEASYNFLIDYSKIVIKQPAGLYNTQNAEAERAATSQNG